MLKALELIGFKSFADRTRFEFPPGITVVVGPNGSGKSNIVDAIKWVLGEQSVKSLRGKEMVDVIFNGAAGRKPLNMAEVTLTFDNKQGKLGLDTDEVAITRRVYRSGEAEYLINRNPCRLRDIRDLFAGTGVATEAYSVIEQGKVDVLLQSSPKERRLIFEEAAGISRFKMKKLECQRRLERVEQNLLRLSDIVDEVESRLKSVRMQATKAKRYQEYADRLQELRTQVAWVDWQKFTAQLDQVQAEQAALQAEIDQLQALIDTAEQQAQTQEQDLLEHESRLQKLEQQQTQQREKILGLEANCELDRGRVQDLNELLNRYRRQTISIRSKAGNMQEMTAETRAALTTAETRQQELRSRLTDEERQLTQLNQQVDQLRSENEQQRVLYLDQMRQVAALANEITALESQLSRSEERREKTMRRLSEITSQRQTTEQLVESQQLARTQQTETLQAQTQQLQTAREQRQQTRQRAQALFQELSEQRAELSRRQERMAVLAEWEREHQGINTGVKSILDQAATNDPGPWQAIRGMVVDLLQTSLELAPILEVVLGEQAQALVVAPQTDFAQWLTQIDHTQLGRVTLLPLVNETPTPPLGTAEQLLVMSTSTAVIGRLDQLIDTTSAYQGIAELLLSHCWLVKDLATAQELQTRWQALTNNSINTSQDAQSHVKHELDDGFPIMLTGVSQGAAWHQQALTTDDQQRRDWQRSGPTLVTQQGEVLWPNGAVTLGATDGASSLFSRRSELRTLRTEVTTLEQHVATLSQHKLELEQLLHEQDQAVDAQQRIVQTNQDQLTELRSQLQSTEQRLAQLQEQYQFLSNDAQVAAEQSQQIIQTRTQRRQQLDQLQLALAQSEARMQENQRRLEKFEELRQVRNRESLTVKVELARCEQQTDNLTRQLRQFEQDRAERAKNLIELDQQLLDAQVRIAQADQAVLVAEQQLAELYLAKEHGVAAWQTEVTAREQLKQSRQFAMQEVQRHRQKQRKLDEKRQKRELTAQSLLLERSALEDRLREDYQIELARVALAPSSDQLQERTTVETEIADLRRKLTNLGGVNLDALQEATELEARYEHLHSQFQDLSKAKHSLEQIIHKINADSRRLFQETLEQVKEHFQSLFRKLFGGGRADILLEENADILESGIEIVARPPGKEPRNISLLSGGEKTLTCVALLLSIFRSRPSPFCVLDEVDAALDEANIQRFVNVLNEFLNWTQFIVVTHSKKTMTCGNTLYGVTMQESGISKRVSVRFEDVSDNGEIRIRDPQQDSTASSDAA
jgi:chromosome segregation protein